MRQLRLALVICVCAALVVGFAMGFLGRFVLESVNQVERCTARGGVWAGPGYCVRKTPAPRPRSG